MTKKENLAFYVSEVALEGYDQLSIFLNSEGDYYIKDGGADLEIYLPGSKIKSFLTALTFLANQK